MEQQQQWKRPQDFKTFRTNDPKKMLGMYLVKPAYKTWTEDFIDESTGELVSIERKQLIHETCEIDQDVLQELMFAIQAGDIEDVEVCESDVEEMHLFISKRLLPYKVELSCGFKKKYSYGVYAQDIQQAILIAAEFGQAYCKLSDYVQVTKVNPISADIVPGDHKCIPLESQKPAYEKIDYFKVTKRSELWDGDRFKKFDHNYIIAASDVGMAKERIARLIDIMRAEAEANGNERDASYTEKILKAVPFAVDYCVPREYSEMYHTDSTMS